MSIRADLWKAVTRRRAMQQEMEEEFRLHIDLRADDLVASGLSRAEAGRRARLEFGSTARYRDEASAARGLSWLDRLQLVWIDIKVALRVLLRRPLYFTGSAGTLAIGIAAASIVTAVAWHVWFAPMPYASPDRVLRLYEIGPGDPTASPEDNTPEARRHQFSPALIEDLREQQWTSIDAVSAVLTGISADWSGDGESRRLSQVTLSPDGFGILGLVPNLGRLPSVDAEEVLISDRFWRTGLGADSAVIGSTLLLRGQAVSVVGVADFPSGFPGDVDLIAALEWDEDDRRERQLRFSDAIARLRPGHTVADAEAELNAYAARIGETYPEVEGWGIDAILFADDLVRPFRDVIALLLGAGGTFLLLAFANVTGLFAARRVEGRHDRSIRLALGASEARLLRSSLVESLVPSVSGSIVGVGLAYGLLGPIRALVPHEIPRLEEAEITPGLIGAGLLLGILLGVAVGVVGHMVSRKGTPAVGRAPRPQGVSRRSHRLLILTQIILTTFLTSAGAAILYRVYALTNVDLGFRVEGVSTASTFLPASRYSSPAQRWALWEAILTRFEARGLTAAIATNIPLAREELPPLPLYADSTSAEIFYEFHPVSREYFSVMGVQLLAGRFFDALEGSGESEDVVLVSEDLARRMEPSGPIEAVLGRIVGPIVGAGDATIIGVVGSTRHEGPDIDVIPDAYAPLAQYSLQPASLLVRGDPEQVAGTFAEVVSEADSELVWSPLISYDDHLREWFAPFRLQLVMTGCLSLLGLLLACGGLYSLISHEVASQRHAFGVRKALGASNTTLLMNVFSRGLLMAGSGIFLGLALWHSLLPFTGSLVEGIGGSPLLVASTAVVVIGAACLAATFAPALRAARVDPALILQGE
jgi:putative ABC transport system permease protein